MRYFFSVAALIAAILIPVGPAAAEERVEPDTKLLLLLDASGSMAEPAGDGLTRIDAARNALHEVVQALPDNAQVGMRVFGAQHASDDVARRCQDTNLVVPVGQLDRDEITREINAYEPRGYTPIGPALLAAGDDLGDEGRRVVVLLSDGQSYCDPDPCEAASTLREGGVDVTIHVVGLDVDTSTREQLECIAREGGGSYYDVNNPQLLSASLRALTVRSLRPPSLSGERTEGASSSTDATLLEPGQYLDTVGDGDTSRFYAVNTPENGGLVVTATGFPQRPLSPSTPEQLQIDIMAPDGTRCVRAEERLNTNNRFQILSVGALHTPQVINTNEVCNDANRLIVHLRSRGEAPAYDVELTVRTIPELLTRDDLPSGLEEFVNDFSPVSLHDSVEPVTGGTSFSDAPRLEPGTYRDTIQPGEHLVYRVPANWGQRPRATVTLGVDSNVRDTLDGSSINADIYWASPLRNVQQNIGNVANGIQTSTRYNGSNPSSLTAASPEIRYLNQSESTGRIGNASLAGDYYIIVDMGTRDGAEGLAIPFTVSVELDGEPSGVPNFDGEIEGPTPEDEDDSDNGDGFPWLPVALASAGGLLIMAALIVLAILLLRRRN